MNIEEIKYSEIISNLLEAVKELHDGDIDKKEIEVYELSKFLIDLIKSDKENKIKILEHEKETLILNTELQKFKAAVDNASDFISIINQDNKILYINQSFLDYVWFSYDELVWRRMARTLRALELEEELDNILYKISHTKKPFTRNIKTVKKDGSSFISEVNYTPIYWKKEKLEFYLLIERDITRDLELERMKNEFLSIASHELRTPMTVIKWYGAILQSEKFWKLTEQQEKYVSRIWNNIDRLIDIVNDMLDLSRMESWKQNFDYKEFDIWKLLREDMKDYFWDICEKKNINLVIEAFALNVISDSEKIKQVLINLVWNAYKFTPEWWQIKIILTIVWSKKFQITVRDTWIWIPDNKLSNIFKKFYQVDNPLQKSEEWTWLGLPISKQIIESLWGNIKARNNKRWTWSSFFFVLDINGWKKNENRTSLEN